MYTKYILSWKKEYTSMLHWFRRWSYWCRLNLTPMLVTMCQLINKVYLYIGMHHSKTLCLANNKMSDSASIYEARSLWRSKTLFIAANLISWFGLVKCMAGVQTTTVTDWIWTLTPIDSRSQRFDHIDNATNPLSICLFDGLFKSV